MQKHFTTDISIKCYVAQTCFQYIYFIYIYIYIYIHIILLYIIIYFYRLLYIIVKERLFPLRKSPVSALKFVINHNGMQNTVRTAERNLCQSR